MALASWAGVSLADEPGDGLATPEAESAFVATAGGPIAPRGAAAAERTPIVVDAGVDAESVFYAYARSGPRAGPRIGGSLRIEPKLRIRRGRFRAQLAGILRADNLDYVRSGKLIDPAGDDDVRRTLELGETFVAADRGPLSVRAGRLIFAWGTADSVNPVDVLNPRDYSDIVEFEKVPVNALELQYFGEGFGLTGVILPGFQPARLSAVDSRFFPPAPRFQETPSGRVPIDFVFRNGSRDEPDVTGSELPFALKAEGSLRGVDLFASYFQGATPDALIEISPGLPRSDGVELRIERTFPRQRILGTGFVTYLGGVGLRGEAAYFKDLDNQGDDYIQAVVGGDYRWNDLIGDLDVGVNLQYALDRRRARGRVRDQSASVMSRVFADNVLLRLDLELNADRRLLLEGTFNTEDSDGFAKAEVELRVAQSWILGIGVDVFYGQDDGFFAQFDRNDRAYLRIKAAY